MHERAAAYLSEVPRVETARMPLGTIFFADGCLYQVIETSAGGYHKARQWRKSESTDVALIPNSFPSRRLALVEYGYLLPVYRSRRDLLQDNDTTCFVFPTEELALDAAYLDVELVRSSDAYVRAHASDPAYEVTDGAHSYRVYYFRLSVHGRPTNLSSLRSHMRTYRPQPHTDGPGYWTLLPSWCDYGTDVESTQPSLSSTRPSGSVQPDV